MYHLDKKIKSFVFEKKNFSHKGSQSHQAPFHADLIDLESSTCFQGAPQELVSWEEDITLQSESP